VDTLSTTFKKEHGYRLHVIQTEKFKTTQIVVKFKEKLNRETITKRALLPALLRHSTKRYSSRQALQRMLDELYGASFRIDSAKKGNDHVMSLRLEIANEKYISTNEQILTEAIALIKEVIFKPNVENDSFIDSVVEREKDVLKQRINGVKDDKMAFANQRLLDEMYKNDLFSIHSVGYEEDLASIDGKEMFNYYEEMLRSNDISIYISGDVDKDDVTDQIVEQIQFPTDKKPEVKLKNESNTIKKDAQTIIEKEEIHQAKLHLGYRTNRTIKDADYPSLQVLNGLFGGFPNSKLFMNVREKHSLAYYASSMLEGLKGLLIVVSGIASEDYEKARKIIDEQLLALKSGDFTEEHIEETKHLLIHQLRSTLDHPQGMIEFDYQNELAELDRTPESFIQQIKNVTKEDIIECAKDIQLDTVYLLTSESGDTDVEA